MTTLKPITKQGIYSRIIFPGFYETIYSIREDEENEGYNTELTYEENKVRESRISRQIFEKGNEYLKEVGVFKKLGIQDIVFEKLHSPKEYNYINDQIYCTYILNSDINNDIDDLIDIELKANNFNFEYIYYDIDL